MALHAQTWKLARHGRIRTRRSDEPMPEATHSRKAESEKRSRRLGAPSKQAPRQGRLAIHNRKRPGQAQEALSPIRMTRATPSSTFPRVERVAPSKLSLLIYPPLGKPIQR